MLGGCERPLVQLGRDDVREARLARAGPPSTAYATPCSCSPASKKCSERRAAARRRVPRAARARSPTRPWISRRRRNESPSYAVARTRSWRKRSVVRRLAPTNSREPLPALAVAGARAISSARISPEQVELERGPTTAAYRSSIRSAGSSVSMRVVSRLSTVSGSSSRVARASANDELADEERVAARRARPAPRPLDRERELVRDGERQLRGRSSASGSSSSRVPWPLRARSARLRARRHADEPRAHRRLPRRGGGAGTATRRRASARPRRRAASASSGSLEERLDGLVELVAARRGRARRPPASTAPRRRTGSRAAEATARGRASSPVTNGCELRAGLPRARCSGVIPTSWRSSVRTAKNGVGDAYCSRAPSSCWKPSASVRSSCDEARLADTGLADELDDLELPHACCVDRLLRELELRLASDDRRRVGLCPRRAADRRHRRVCAITACSLPLTSSGSSRSRRSCARGRARRPSRGSRRASPAP